MTDQIQQEAWVSARALSDEFFQELSVEQIYEAGYIAGASRAAAREPTDAEVLAALNAYYADYMIGPNTSLHDVRPPRTVKDMRAALLAAQAVRRG